VSAILAQTDRMKQIIRGLLGLARGDAPSAERIQPAALVRNALALVEHRFARAGVRLGDEIEPELPTIVGDPRLLEHALVNLLLNACEACARDGEVTVAARRAGDDVRAVIELAVDDDGVGMSPAELERAREPFFTTKARAGGTGLGLALAQEIVTSHRGQLSFRARAPRGTRAVIELPSGAETTAAATSEGPPAHV